MKPWLPAIIMALLAAPWAWMPAHAKPARIVTTNVCADQLALILAERSRIISVSRLAADPGVSNLAREAEGLPVNGARAEEIVMLHPDIVLGDIYTGKAANSLARTIGVPVHFVDAPSSLDDVRRIIRAAAMALGEAPRGEQLVAEMDARIAALPRPEGPRVTALVYEPNGVTSGRGTLSDDILAAAGLDNLAPRLTGATYGAVPLEAVVAAAPQLLVLDDSYTGTSSRAQAILRHRAFRSLTSHTQAWRIRSRLWLCPGPWVAEAVAGLAEQRQRISAKLASAPKQE